MLSEKLLAALNYQLNRELYSAYLYLSMAAWCDSIDLPGFSHWMQLQAKEEVEHAEKIFHYVIERNSRVQLQAIEEPPSEWSSPLEVFTAVLEHEQKVTGLINGLVKLARAEDDYATEAFLQWFVTEQVEEEASAGAVVARLKLVGSSGGMLLMLDRELGSRSDDEE